MMFTMFRSFFSDLVQSRFGSEQLQTYRVLYRPRFSGGYLMTAEVQASNSYEAARAFDTDPAFDGSTRVEVREIS